MGGFGSGVWNATGRTTTADVLRLSVGELNKHGTLRENFSGTIGWANDGQQKTVQIRAFADCIFLSSEHSTHASTEQIPIAWDACRFGGRRPFFNCPACGERNLHLYYLERFCCRKCHRLSYASQRLRENDRAQRKANRIRIQLGGEPGWHNIPAKPKGMHRRTYFRMVRVIAEADAITDRHAQKLLSA